MTVRYVRVNPVSDLFAPAVRAYGNIAIVGTVTPPNPAPPTCSSSTSRSSFTDPAEARRRAPGRSATPSRSPSPSPPGRPRSPASGSTTQHPTGTTGLAVLATQDVQIVALADAPLDATTGATDGSVRALADHVVSVSNTGGDGMERMGVAMLAKGATDPTVVTGALVSERMVYVAHKSDEDVAAAVAGTIAGYEPHISMLLKPVDVDQRRRSPPPRSTQLNGSETLRHPARRARASTGWSTRRCIPGQGIYLGEGYTGDPAAARSTSTSSAPSTTSRSCSRRD